MPTYEYRCNGCDHEFEEFQSISARPLRKCPECGERALERLIGTGAGIIFKGSGFYETDYRSESYKKAAEAEKSNGKADAKKDKKTSDSGGASEKKETKKPSGGDAKSKGGGCGGPSCACSS